MAGVDDFRRQHGLEIARVLFAAQGGGVGKDAVAECIQALEINGVAAVGQFPHADAFYAQQTAAQIQQSRHLFNTGTLDERRVMAE